MGFSLVLLAAFVEAMVFSRYQVMGVTPAITIVSLLWASRYIGRRKLIMSSFFAALILDALSSISLLAMGSIVFSAVLVSIVSTTLPKKKFTHQFIPGSVLILAATSLYIFVQYVSIIEELGSLIMLHFLLLTLVTTMGIWALSHILIRN